MNRSIAAELWKEKVIWWKKCLIFIKAYPKQIEHLNYFNDDK